MTTMSDLDADPNIAGMIVSCECGLRRWKDARSYDPDGSVSV